MDYDIVIVGESNPITHAYEVGKSVPVCGKKIRVNSRFHHVTIHERLVKEWFNNSCELCVDLTN